MSGIFFDDPRLFESVLETLPIGIYILDRERRIRFWSRSAEQITGYLAHEVMGQACHAALCHCNGQGVVLCDERCPVTATFQSGHSQESHAFSLHKQGHRVGVRVRTVPLPDSKDSIAGVAVVFEEAPANGDAESFIPQMYGCLDPVTGVPSQRLTRAVVREMAAELKETQHAFGLLWIQVLGLEEFRTRHGPQSALPFLRTSAQTIRCRLSAEDFLGRWGEDEFLAVLHSTNPVAVAATAESIWRLLGQSQISWWGDRFLVEAVVASAVARPGDVVETLLDEMKSCSGGEWVKAAGGTRVAHDSGPLRG